MPAARRHSKDVVAVIEAVYALDRPERAWLEGIAEATHSILDDGLGVSALTYRLEAGGMTLQEEVAWRVNPELERALMMGNRDHNAAMGALHRVVCGTLSTASGKHWPAIQAYMKANMQRHGLRDIMGVVSTDPTGCGVSLAVFRRKVSSLSPSQRRTWSRVAAHMAAALRLRYGRAREAGARSLPEVGPFDAPGSEAILTPNGNVEHAERAARAPISRADLRRAVLSLERSRGRLRHDDPDGALRGWQALVDGRWSLVDAFDSDGRRYLVARRNDPRVTRPHGLSPSERLVLAYRALGHPLKLVAYELGWSIANVAGQQKRAMAKLGIRNATELVTLFAAV